MGIFTRKKSTKDVGKSIGQSIARTKQKEKIIRTLKVEAAQREKEEKANREIRLLKAKRPTAGKKVIKAIGKGVKGTRTGIEFAAKLAKATPKTARQVGFKTSKKKKKRRVVQRVQTPARQKVIGFESFS